MYKLLCFLLDMFSNYVLPLLPSAIVSVFCVVELPHIILILKTYSFVLEKNGLFFVGINQFYLSPFRIILSYLKI